MSLFLLNDLLDSIGEMIIGSRSETPLYCERWFTVQPTGVRKWPGVTVSTWGVEQEDTGAEWDTWTEETDTGCDAADFYTGVLHLAYKEGLLFQMQSHKWIRK